MPKQPRYYNMEHALHTLEHGKPNRSKPLFNWMVLRRVPKCSKINSHFMHILQSHC